MLVPLCITALVVFIKALNPEGDNVCQHEERYTVNTTQYFFRNVTIRNYQWCLRIPPRCSAFTYKTINDSKIVEEEKLRYKPICCNGFQQDSSAEICIPVCNDCINGECDKDRKCYCYPGYRGENCEKACEFSRWGRYCRYHCTCERGKCNPQTGHCECPNGWTGTRCEHQCREGYFGAQCRSQCKCSMGELCSPISGSCTSSQKVEETTEKPPSTSKKYSVFNVSTLHLKEKKHRHVDQFNPRTVDLYVLTSTDYPSSTTTLTKLSTITTEAKSFSQMKIANERDSSSIENTKQNEMFLIKKTTLVKLSTEHSVDVVSNEIKQELQNVNIKTTDRPVDVMKRDALKGKATGEVSGTPIVLATEETRSNGGPPLEVVHRDNGLPNNGLISVTTMVITATLLVVITGLYITTVNLRKRKPKETSIQLKSDIDDKNNMIVPQAISSKSIFHTPLPDLPSSVHVTSNFLPESATFNVSEERGPYFENKKCYLDFLYDHPPSTGSYRAAPVPEPPASNFNSSQLEPLYDEIPYWIQEKDKICDLYINTMVEDRTEF